MKLAKFLALMIAMLGVVLGMLVWSRTGNRAIGACMGDAACLQFRYGWSQHDAELGAFEWRVASENPGR